MQVIDLTLLQTFFIPSLLRATNSGAFRSLHCLIYKVLAPSAQRRNIAILTHRSSFVKPFFLLFSKFFRTLIQTHPASGQLDYFTTFTPLCQAFFASFLKFFISLHKSVSFADSLVNIAPFLLFVNYFFAKKSDKFAIFQRHFSPAVI